MRLHASLRCIAAAAALVAAGETLAVPVTLVPDTVNMFRDTRGANSVGIGAGERWQFGADIVGGSLGTNIDIVHLPSGFTNLLAPCGPLAVNANFCAGATTFNANRLLGDWQIRFHNGPDITTVIAPSVADTAAAVPFPVSVTLSGTGLTPTISWQVPSTFTPNGFRVNIFDKNDIRPNGTANVIHSIAIDPNSTSYTIPTLLTSGQQLAFGGNYAINLQLIDTRNDQPFTSNNNADILRRSSSFFDFRPLSDSGPPNVALPTIDQNGVYNFNVTNVGPSEITFIDPEVAVGYDYAIGLNNPNFASVLLPDVGDGVFTLQYDAGNGLVTQTIEDGQQFFFGQQGVSSFRVTGIETDAGLDPNDPLAFITGLTFVAQGDFTGTMTPLTVNVVPEPETYALMLLGLAGLTLQRRRAKR